MKEPLTDNQKQVLDYIRGRCDEGSPPSYREIQENFGYKAVGTVQDHVKALVRKGHLEDPKSASGGRRSRGLYPVGFKREGLKQLPIYGEIAAGSTRETDQVELGTLSIGTSLSKDAAFALRVVGDSMINAGILEGDHVIVEKGASIRNGDIVVALLNGETTVKRYEKKGRDVLLIPENDKMKPIKVGNGEFSIQGKVVGLQRKF